MHERFYQQNDEDIVDEYLKKGEFTYAESDLASLLKKNLHPDIMHHISIKQATLPLYEMLHGHTNEEVIDDANDIYGVVGNLLRGELYTFSHSYHKEVGRITELTYLALHLRSTFDNETQTVTVPASRRSDRWGIDFYECPVGIEKTDAGWPVQVKTSATKDDRDKANRQNVAMISMIDIDPFAGDPNHPDSLARCILRELCIPTLDSNRDSDRSYSEADSRKLDQCLSDIQSITRNGPMMHADPKLADRIRNVEKKKRKKKMEPSLSKVALSLVKNTGTERRAA